MTRECFNRYRCLKMTVIFVVACISCSLVSRSVYAEGKKVLPPTLTITLQDEDGAPIAGVDIAAMAVALAGTEKDRAKTDINGKAVFKHLKSGTYYFFADIKAIHKHDGYDFPSIIKEIKTTRSYYISETKQFDLSENVECTFTIRRNAYILFETYLDVFKSNEIVVVNKNMGISQNIPVASADYTQIYLPMRSRYQIITIKDGDFDSWVIDFFAHEGLRIELL